MKMRPGYTSRFIQEPRIIHVRTADLIPSGMHGARSRTHDRIVEDMVFRGVPAPQARAIVRRAIGRFRGRERRVGLGDAAADTLASISADAKFVQGAHRRYIASMAKWEEDTPGWVTNNDELRSSFTSGLTNLYRDFVARSLKTLGVGRPDQIDRADPAGAIVIAVRDDIVQTIDLLDARKAQQMLAKHISDLPKPGGLPSLNIKIPDIPWYVWAGAAGVGLLTLKTMLR